MEDSRQIVVVGLGNPGKNYEMTRHNMGFLVVQALAYGQQWSFKDEKQFHAKVAKGRIGQITVHLLLPQTYMNESGRAVRSYLDFYKLGAPSVIVVTDDVDLDFGEMRVRMVGSPGGHNGLKSIQAHLHTTHYVRLRMGIGKEEHRGVLADYVLDRFSQSEESQLAAYLTEGVHIVHRLIAEEASVVMNTVNRTRPKSREKEDVGEKQL